MPGYNYIAPTTDTAGVERGNAQKQFGGTVLMSFRRTTLFWDMRQTFMRIKSIKGVQGDVFPVLGSDPEAEHHIPGDDLLGQSQPFDNLNIFIDDFIVAHRFIPGDDDVVSHFSVWGPYAKAIGRQLGNSADDKAVRKLIQAARTPANPGFHNGGQTVTRIGGGATLQDCYPLSITGAVNLRSDMRQMALQQDQAEVPNEPGIRKMVLKPYGRAVLQYDPTVFSRDYQEGKNDAMSRKIGECEGFDLYISNQSIPSTRVINSGPRFNVTKYDVDCRYANPDNTTGEPIAVACVAATDDNAALGMVVNELFFTAMDPQPFRGGTRMMGRNYLGIDKLAVWCAGEIRGAKTLY